MFLEYVEIFLGGPNGPKICADRFEGPGMIQSFSPSWSLLLDMSREFVSKTIPDLLTLENDTCQNNIYETRNLNGNMELFWVI